MLQSLWVVKCCFLYVPTLTELSHTGLNECIYSQIPTEPDGGGLSRTSVPVPAQCSVVAPHCSCSSVGLWMRHFTAHYYTCVFGSSFQSGASVRDYKGNKAIRNGSNELYRKCCVTLEPSKLISNNKLMPFLTLLSFLDTVPQMWDVILN